MFQAMLASCELAPASFGNDNQQQHIAIDLCPPPPPLMPLAAHRQLPMTPNNNNNNNFVDNNDESSDDDDEEDGSDSEDTTVQQNNLVQQQPAQCRMQSYQQQLIDMSSQRATVGAAAYFQQIQQQQPQQNYQIQNQPSNAQQFANNYHQQLSTATMQIRAPPPVAPPQKVAEQTSTATTGNQPTPRVPVPPPRSRAAYNRYQREFLNAVFERIHYPSRIQREAISRCLGGVVNQNQIKVWFQNARRRAVLRGVKFPPGRLNPTDNSVTPMAPPQNLPGPGSEMVDTYFATIRHFVNQIVDLADNSSAAQEATAAEKERPSQVAGNKRARPVFSDDEEDEIVSAPVEKRPAVVATPPRNVVVRSVAEQQNSASSTAVACISPNTTNESGFNSFHSSHVLVDSVQEETGQNGQHSPTEIRSFMGSRASSGVMSSLSNYASPPLNAAPLAGSTPTEPAFNQFGGFLDQRFVLANAMRAAQTAQQSYYNQLISQNQSPSFQYFVPPMAQRVHSVANFVQQNDAQRSSCAFSSDSSKSSQPSNFYAPYSSCNFGYTAPSVTTSYPYAVPQQNQTTGANCYYSQPQAATLNAAAGFVAQSFAAQLAAQLTSSSVSSATPVSSSMSSDVEHDSSSTSDQ